MLSNNDSPIFLITFKFNFLYFFSNSSVLTFAKATIGTKYSILSFCCNTFVIPAISPIKVFPEDVGAITS